MKKKFVAFALFIVGIASLASGCVVREGGYGHPYHHGYYRGW